MAPDIITSIYYSNEEISFQTIHGETYPIQRSSQNEFRNLENRNMKLDEVLVMLDILQEYLSFSNINEIICLGHQICTIRDLLIDVNNNNFSAKTITDVKQDHVDTNSTENFVNDIEIEANDKNVITDTSNCFNENTKVNDCNCNDVKKCNPNVNSDHACCANCIPQSITVCTSDYLNFPCEKGSTTVSTNNVNLSMKEIYNNTSYPAVYEKYKKSIYRDASNDLCVEKIVKNMKTSMSLHCSRNNLTHHLEKSKNLSREEEKEKLSGSTECLDNSTILPIYPAESFPLLITDRQGLIEIHISRLQLFTSAVKISEKEEEDICNLNVYISWDIWDEKTAYTPRMKYPNLNFNSSSVYRITDLFSFFKNILSEYLIFQVNIVRQNDTSYAIAKAKVSIKDILDYPQNKLHYIVPVNSVISSFLDNNFGQLSLWVRLSCNVNMVEDFKKRCGITSLRDESYALREQKETDGVLEKTDSSIFNMTTSINRNSEGSSEFEISDDRLISSFDSNWKREKSGDEDGRNNLNKRPTSSTSASSAHRTYKGKKEQYKMKQGPDYKRREKNKEERRRSRNEKENTDSLADIRSIFSNSKNDVFLLDGSTSTIRDMNEVLSDKNWESYKQKSLLTFSSKIKSKLLNVGAQDYQQDTSVNCVQDCPRLERDEIVLEIVSAKFIEGCYILTDAQIHLLYIEYSFLDHHGEDMETISVHKPRNPSEEMAYNFRKRFRVDEQNHSKERNYLCAMLKEEINPNIKFIIVSEPLDEEAEVEDCVEVGYAHFNIKTYALGDGSKEIKVPIVDEQSVPIGTLKLLLLGYESIRQCLPVVRTNVIASRLR